jgi:hypothetical protein
MYHPSPRPSFPLLHFYPLCASSTNILSHLSSWDPFSSLTAYFTPLSLHSPHCVPGLILLLDGLQKFVHSRSRIEHDHDLVSVPPSRSETEILSPPSHSSLVLRLSG